MIRKKRVQTIVLLLMSISFNACMVSWNERDGSSFNSLLAFPVEIGTAVYRVSQSSILSIEFRPSSDCTRFAPLDSHRITITRKGKDGETTSIVDQYISKELEKFEFLDDSDGRYEATVFQQNQPENFNKKLFTLGDISKILIMKLPCLK